MRNNKFLYGMVLAGAMLVGSCSDYDDWNTANSSRTSEATQTLWDNICANEDLSQFASILQKTGYDKELQNNRFYTVWAPKNGTFDDIIDSLENKLDSVTLLKKFVKNHIANYNFSMSSGMATKRVHTLNDKSYELSAENGFTYDGINIQPTNANLPSLNGVMHVMDGYAPFYSNIYEHLSEVKGADSLTKYLLSYEQEYVDVNKSVEGAIDSLGRQTYSDSVMVTENYLISHSLKADLEDEDSSYTMVIPNDDAYTKAYNAYKKYFNYASTVQYWPWSDDGAGTMQKETVDPILADSLVKMRIARMLIYSNNDGYNKWLNGGEKQYLDTLRSTTSLKLSNGSEFINGHMVGSRVRMSNGYAVLVDTLAAFPWESFCGDVSVPIFQSSYRPYSYRSSFVNTNLVDNSTNSIIASYVDVRPDGDNAKPTAYFRLPSVLSTSYNVYVVFVPQSLVGDTLPLKVTTYMNYADASGALNSSSSRFAKTFDEVIVPVTQDDGTNSLDTICVGQVEFPVAYSGLSSAYPYICLEISASSTQIRKKQYSNRMRIAGIVLRPVEYDNYQPFVTNKED